MHIIAIVLLLPTSSEQLTVTDKVDPANIGAVILSSSAIFSTTKPVVDDMCEGLSSHLTAVLVCVKIYNKSNGYYLL